MNGATRHHLTISGRPYCEWTGCMAGQQIAGKSGVHACTYGSQNSARRAKSQLQTHFKRGAVAVVSGDCPADAKA